MNLHSRIGSPSADIVLFNKGGRDFRLERLLGGHEVPREFFYGFLELAESGIPAAMMSSAGRLPGPLGLLADTVERGFAWLTSLGIRPLSTRLSGAHVSGAKAVISYTDGFSLSLGLGFPRRAPWPVLIGGFHGLSDIEDRAPLVFRGLVRGLISRSVARLDHAFFFGPSDRMISIERYGLAPERSSVFAFGVDTDFWRPLDHPADDFVVAIGQDRNRDYDLLAAAPGHHPIRIVTRRPVKVPPGATNVSTTAGDFFRSDAMSDEDLRQLYNMARAVVVPLKDVHQPTGYSVTLQAMACGRPVILSNIKGLWTHTLLKSGVNCLLVPPGDAKALGEAIGQVRANPSWAADIGRAARETAIAHFGLDKVGNGSIALAHLGLALHSQAEPRAL